MCPAANAPSDVGSLTRTAFASTNARANPVVLRLVVADEHREHVELVRFGRAGSGVEARTHAIERGAVCSFASNDLQRGSSHTLSACAVLVSRGEARAARGRSEGSRATIARSTAVTKMTELDPDVASKVLAIARAKGLLDAIAFLRAATGATLADAHAALRLLASSTPGLLRAPTEDAMGMNAEVFALGPFQRRIAHLLDYDADRYSGVSEGTEVSVRVIHSLTGSTQSTAVARALGFEPWDFAAHSFDGSRVDVEALKRALRLSCADPSPESAAEANELVEPFVALRDAGFRFLFRPNG
jgi:hypothetical protein